MPVRVYKTNNEQLLAEGQLIVSSTDDSKFQHKVEKMGSQRLEIASGFCSWQKECPL